jgi:hypothetical protein
LNQIKDINLLQQERLFLQRPDGVYRLLDRKSI